MMNFLKDWIIQHQNKYSVGGTETTIDRITGTVSQEGDTISAAYLNEIQKNCIYQVNATRVIEGVLEIYDVTIDGSEDFTPFNQTFLIDFDVTNTQVDSLLRFNGITYSLRFSGSITNGDIAPKIGFLPKRALVKLDVTNSKAIIFDLNPNNFVSPAFTGAPTAPTQARGDNSTKIATTDFATGQDLGVGQSWQNVKADRASGSTYTNTTGKPILVSVAVTLGNSQSADISVNVIQVCQAYASNSISVRSSMSTIVPAGATYRVYFEGTCNVWSELR